MLFEYISRYLTLKAILFILLELPSQIKTIIYKYLGYGLPKNVLCISKENLNVVDFTKIKKQSILCFHGSSSSPYQWRVMLPELEKTFPNYTIILLDFGIKDLCFEEYLQFIKNVLGGMEYEPSHFIGISMGGVLASITAEKLCKFNKTVITINSPLRGAPALEFLPSIYKRYFDMKPSSKTIKELFELLEKSTNKYICITTKDDIQVPEAFAVAPKSKIFSFQGGHNYVIYFPKNIWCKVIQN